MFSLWIQTTRLQAYNVLFTMGQHVKFGMQNRAYLRAWVLYVYTLVHVLSSRRCCFCRLIWFWIAF